MYFINFMYDIYVLLCVSYLFYLFLYIYIYMLISFIYLVYLCYAILDVVH